MNEFIIKNGLIVESGTTTVTGSVTATGGFTGSLFGTASVATSLAGGALTNFIEGFSSATQATSFLSASNAAATVNISIDPKGSGSILGSVPDGTAVGGNARGIFAIDLQMSRGTAAQVASGNYSVIAGGASNLASGLNTTVAGGASNTATNNYNTVGGGQANTANGSNWATVAGGYGNGASANGNVVAGGYQNNCGGNGYSAIVGGESNSLGSQFYGFIGAGQSNSNQASYGVICGGRSNSVSAGSSDGTIGGGQSNTIFNSQWTVIGGGQSNSSNPGAGQSNQHNVIAGGLNNISNSNLQSYTKIPGGAYASATLYGQFAHASGRFSATGDAQAHELIWRNIITGTAQTELFLDGTSIAAILPGTNAIWNGIMDVVAVCTVVGNGTTVVGDVEATSYKVTIKRIGTTTSLVGGVQEIGITNADASMSTSVFTIDNNDTNESLRVRFTPPSTAGSTTVIRTLATFRGQQIQY